MADAQQNTKLSCAIANRKFGFPRHLLARALDVYPHARTQAQVRVPVDPFNLAAHLNLHKAYRLVRTVHLLPEEVAQHLLISKIFSEKMKLFSEKMKLFVAFYYHA